MKDVIAEEVNNFISLCKTGDIKGLRLLFPLLTLHHIKFLCNSQNKALIAAISNEHIHVIEYLLQHAFDPNEPDYLGLTPLQHAISTTKSIEICTLLLAAGADVNAHSSTSLSPLQLALKKKNKPLWLFLCKHGAEIPSGDTLFYEEYPYYKGLSHEELGLQFLGKCEFNHFNDVEEMIALKDILQLDINFRNKYGLTPIWAAYMKRHNAIVKLLLEQPEIDLSKRDMHGLTFVDHLIQTGDINLISTCLSKNLVTQSDEGHDSLLITAIINDRLEIVRLLLCNDYKPYSAYENNNTPIIKAVECHGSYEIVSLLVDKGADVLTLNSDGNTLLEVVKNEKTKAFLKEKCSAAINKKFKDASKHLDKIAVKECLTSPFKDLININEKDKLGFTPLNFFINNHCPDIAKLLIEFEGCDLNCRYSNGRTPLHFAASKGFPELTKLLLDKGAERLVVDDDNNTPLHRCPMVEIYEHLLAASTADINVQDKNGCTPLTVIILLQHGTHDLYIVIANVLLQHGANPNIQNKAGNTALHYAVKHKYFVKQLLQYGADPTIANNDGLIPSDQKNATFLVKELLERHLTSKPLPLHDTIPEKYIKSISFKNKRIDLHLSFDEEEALNIFNNLLSTILKK